MHTPEVVANYFICRALAEAKPLTPLQVLKLVYYAHGYNLAINNQALINEPVHAWQYGPVINSLYHVLKKYGRRKITEPIIDEVWRDTEEFDREELEILDAVFEELSEVNGLVLSELTHQEDTPWYSTFRRKEGRRTRDLEIDNNKIKNHFRELLSGGDS